jgi:release factor glutamine methyltransferase
VDIDWDLEVEVAPHVFRPAEDSYLLLRAVEVGGDDRFVEVGTGTGFVALHAAQRARSAVATDVNPSAVRCARDNARRNDVPLAVVRTDLLRGLRGRFDVIAFNPPYLIEAIGGDWEERAWQGGVTGEDIALRFLDQLRGHLAPGGRAYIILPSNRANAFERAKESFVLTVAAKRPLFFETLLALELSVPG